MMGTAFCYVYVYTLLPDVVSHVSGQGTRLQRRRPGAVGAALRGRGVRESGGWSGQRRPGAAPGPEVGPPVARHRRTGHGVPLHHRGHGHRAAAAHRHSALARLWRDHLPAVGSLRRVPGHRAEARGIDGRADEHVGAGGRPALLPSPTATSSNASSSYDAPFVPMAALLFLGTLLWFRIDASQELSAKPVAVAVPVV